MRKITLADVKNLHEYELIRDAWRQDVIQTKARRRVTLGPKMSLVFENRLTVLNQIQEMCRTERLARPELVQHEIDVYNELLPDPGELAATLLIEITEEESVRPELDRLLGLTTGRHVFLELRGRRVYARFLEGQSREDRVAAVQYVRFPVLKELQRAEQGAVQGIPDGMDLLKSVLAALGEGEAPVHIGVDHPGYRALSEVPPETRRELARDLLPD